MLRFVLYVHLWRTERELILEPYLGQLSEQERTFIDTVLTNISDGNFGATASAEYYQKLFSTEDLPVYKS